MKILILSDLHLEFANLPPPEAEVDVVVLAGDIWKKVHGIYWARSTWPETEIIYVAGNHEFYRGDRSDVLRQLRDAADETGVHFLDNDEVIINCVRFLGATLWTDFLLFGVEQQVETMNAAFSGLNDFRKINQGEHLFTPADSISICNTSTQWLKSKLLNEQFQGKSVVVTHHLPSMKSVAERYKQDLLSACFASNLDYMLGYSDLWIHGHAHDSFDYKVGKTRIICNPRGYVFKGIPENSGFNSEFVIEV